MKYSLVTGGAGFIGSHLADYLIEQGDQVLVLDKLTYAGDLKNLEEAQKTGCLTFVEGDICDQTLVYDLLKKYDVKTVYHLAAESHVDNSINDSSTFIQTNIFGTHSMLSAALKYWEEKNRFPEFRFVHASTDEVFGQLSEKDPPFNETSPYAPNSPYSASKAASDHLARAWFHTYKLPVIITNCSNNYGPRQHSEKLIPTIIRKALEEKPIPIYGSGKNIRDWLYVNDHCEGLHLAALKGRIGESYCFGGNNEKRNIDLAKEICYELDKLKPRSDGKSYMDQIIFVEDRKGHDFRYAIDSGKSTDDLGYHPKELFTEMLSQTILYLEDFYKSPKEMVSDLSTSRSLDLATQFLNFEKFKELAQNSYLSEEEKIGFAEGYRTGFEEAICQDIEKKLLGLNKAGNRFLDIGCGASNLTLRLADLFEKNGFEIVLNDSLEMLRNLPELPSVKKVPGKFPDCLSDILKIRAGFDKILCYSVFHYIFADTNVFNFIDSIIECLNPGGIALIGDIPNVSKRKRFFSSQSGIDYHQKFMNTLEKPNVTFYKPEKGKIDDPVLNAIIERARHAGCNAYLLPQPSNLPMHNRRDDLVVEKP